jgi:hypothetical protein
MLSNRAVVSPYLISQTSAADGGEFAKLPELCKLCSGGVRAPCRRGVASDRAG